MKRFLSFADSGLNLQNCLKAAVLTLCLAGPIAVMAGDGSTASLNDPNATPATSAVFNYVKGLVSKPSRRMLEGQHLGGINDVDPPSTGPYLFDMHSFGIADSVGKTRYPGLVGVRYDSYDNRINQNPALYVLNADVVNIINQKLIALWSAGGTNSYGRPIVALTATPPNPWTPSVGRSPDDSPGTHQISSLTRANGGVTDPVAYQNFWSSIDIIADGLQNLQDHGIPVIFRPFAEYNTDKYYFTKQDSAAFVTLWEDVYNYYVNTRHLHNLIFCWEAWVWGDSASQSNMAPWWPGANYVDIVSGAFYFNYKTTYMNSAPPYGLTLSSADQIALDNLLAIANTYNKPFGAAQWGLDYKDPGGTGRGDHQQTLRFIGSNNVPRMAFAYYWSGNNGAYEVQTQANALTFVSDTRVAVDNDVMQVAALTAAPANSGWVLEKSFNSNTGASLGANPAVLRTGETPANTQYRSILSFDLSSIPANAIISSASLQLKRQSLATTHNPFLNLGKLEVDVATNGMIGSTTSLQLGDFTQSSASEVLNAAELPDPGADDLWTAANLTPNTNAILAIQKAVQGSGKVVQMRIRFASSNTNGASNYVNWYAGSADESSGIARQPRLVLSYTVPR